MNFDWSKSYRRIKTILSMGLDNWKWLCDRIMFMRVQHSMIAEWLEIRTKQEKNVYFQVLTNRRCLFNVWLGISLTIFRKRKYIKRVLLLLQWLHRFIIVDYSILCYFIMFWFSCSRFSLCDRYMTYVIFIKEEIPINQKHLLITQVLSIKRLFDLLL
jgi:hypothetical protein